MQTYFSTPNRQYRDETAQGIVNSSVVTQRKILIVFDVIVADVGSFADIELQHLSNGTLVDGVKSRISGVGQSHIGVTFPVGLPNLQTQYIAAVTGRIRSALRVVGFDPGENVPEPIP